MPYIHPVSRRLASSLIVPHKITNKGQNLTYHIFWRSGDPLSVQGDPLKSPEEPLGGTGDPFGAKGTPKMPMKYSLGPMRPPSTHVTPWAHKCPRGHMGDLRDPVRGQGNPLGPRRAP